MVALQLQVVNELTTRSKELKDIIEDAVYRQQLRRITIYGVRGLDAYATLEIAIDYDAKCCRVAWARIAVATERNSGPLTTIDCPTNRPTDAGVIRGCPQWRQAIEMFDDMVRAQRLALHWTVAGGQDHEAMCQRLGLTASSIRNHCNGAPVHSLPNTLLPELNAEFRFSQKLWPET
jgi:hypothetical protein